MLTTSGFECLNPTTFEHYAPGGSDDETSDTEPTRDAPAASPRAPTSSGPRTAGGERYVPGTVIAGRYHIVGLVGRGGIEFLIRVKSFLKKSSSLPA